MASDFERFMYNAIGSAGQGYLNRKAEAAQEAKRKALVQENMANQMDLWRSQYGYQGERDIAKMEADKRLEAESYFGPGATTPGNPNYKPQWQKDVVDEKYKRDLLLANARAINQDWINRNLAGYKSEEDYTLGRHQKRYEGSNAPTTRFPGELPPETKYEPPVNTGAPISTPGSGKSNRNPSRPRSNNSSGSTTPTTTKKSSGSWSGFSDDELKKAAVRPDITRDQRLEIQAERNKRSSQKKPANPSAPKPPAKQKGQTTMRNW